VAQTFLLERLPPRAAGEGRFIRPPGASPDAALLARGRALLGAGDGGPARAQDAYRQTVGPLLQPAGGGGGGFEAVAGPYARLPIELCGSLPAAAWATEPLPMRSRGPPPAYAPAALYAPPPEPPPAAAEAAGAPPPAPHAPHLLRGGDEPSLLLPPHAGHFLLGLFAYYGGEFPGDAFPGAKTHAIDPSRGRVERMEREESMDPLTIRDPLQPHLNVGRNCFRFFYVQAALREARRALAAAAAAAQPHAGRLAALADALNALAAQRAPGEEPGEHLRALLGRLAPMGAAEGLADAPEFPLLSAVIPSLKEV
jgi:hypothetical protein